MARFQVRKRLGLWEVVVLEPGKGAWEIIDSFHTYWQAMTLATGQVPYGPKVPWYRSMRLVWQP